MMKTGRVSNGAVALTAAIALVAVAAPALATLVIPLDLPALVADARTIVHGRVIETRAVVAGGRTETVVTLAAVACLKGEGGREVTFRVPGGRIGRYRTVVVGAPVLHEGDEIVVFLNGAGPALPTVVGFSQGVLRVLRRGGEAPLVLVPPASAGDTPQRVVRGDSARRLIPLTALADDVRALVQGAPGQREPHAMRRPGASRPGGL